MFRSLLLFFNVLAFVSVSPALADEVTLKDGSRILGTIQSLDGGELKMDGGSAGEISIPFSSVEAITTDGEHTVILADGTVLKGRITMSDVGPSVGEQQVEFSSIEAVNPPAKPAVTHNGNVSLSGKATDGNSNTKSLSAFAEYIRRTDNNRTTVFADWNYSENLGELSERNASLRGKYDHFFNQKFFGYGNLSFERDDFADLDLRTTIGGGAGYQFIEDGIHSFYEEVVISFFDEKFDNSPDDEFASARFSGKFDWIIESDRISLFHYHEVFLSLDDSEDVLIDTKTGLRVNVVDNFFATLQFNLKWDNTPATGAERTDTEYLLGLGYSYSF